MMDDTDLDKPATRRDLEHAIDRMQTFVLKREISLYSRFLTLGLVLLAAQWAAITWMMSHWRP